MSNYLQEFSQKTSRIPQFNHASQRQQPPITSSSTRYTPRRTRASDGQIFSRVQNQLTKITQKLDKMNEIDNQDTFRARSNYFEDNKNLKNRQVKKSGQRLIESKQTPLRQRINNYKQQKKQINFTKTHQKNQSSKAINPQNFFESRVREKKSIDNIQAFSLILNQNERLSNKVGQLQTVCHGITQRICYWQEKFEQQSGLIKASVDKQKKQNIYLNNLIEYYKSLAFRLNERLIDNGIETDYKFTTQEVQTDNMQD